ncbi:ATP/GTP-binding protein [Streptomyces sp. W16]|uniref:ATP/GTP-binding protein n=1 Tax=Streptomyces sp. W16 TaxID=3076631 RepID=UPI00295A57D8|nr:ATP/GTP-binding protein [Streptomyces sp. W16]MDV9173888.1 ATP/GTP-binding protein [Streptomyces sp. W16]
MDSDGTRDARGTHANPVPRPARPAEAPGVPPRPTHAPGASGTTVADWLNEPRPAAGPGIWRFGYRVPKPEKNTERLSPITIVGVVVPLVVGMVLWSLWRHGSIPYQWALLKVFTPDDWWWAGTTAPKGKGFDAVAVADGVFFAILVYGMGRLGSWPEIIRHLVTRRPQPARALLALLGAVVAENLVVIPSVFDVGWNALPVAGPVYHLINLFPGGYDFISTPLMGNLLYVVIGVLLLWPFARIGGWLPFLRERYAPRDTAAVAAAAEQAPAVGSRAHWPELREAGQFQAADVLTAEVLAGRMNDVDCARVEHAWRRARRTGELTSFTQTVLRAAGGAWIHPSGSRDLPGRIARHDLLAGQVRIGNWAPGERTPLAYRGIGTALGPDTLGTSLLVVGPSGSGKTRHVVRPVVENLTLQALTGRCAVVVVCAAGAPLGPDEAFDVIVRVGDPASVHDLDLYAESGDPDEAAALLAEALVGDLDTVDTQRAAGALAQLLGPYRAAYGRFPALPVLRELLEGEPRVLAELTGALSDDGHAMMRRELDSRLRHAGGGNDPGQALADRLALLDRPVFAEFFGAGGGTVRPFSLRAVAHHPLRVRIDLPEHGHDEAARLLTRLVLAQFTAVVRGRERGHFACLVLDDATGTVTTESLRRIQRLRSENAGVVLALRTVGDVPEALHGPLYGAVGCRMALAGVTTWDGSRFARAWGTEWVETTDVAKHTVFADQPMTRAIHALRKLITGKAVTTEAVTVRQVERERWSASELAHGVPAGHAVLSLTSVKGEHAPPLLVDLRGPGH